MQSWVGWPTAPASGRSSSWPSPPSSWAACSPRCPPRSPSCSSASAAGPPGVGPRAPTGGHGDRPPESAAREGPADHRHPVDHHRHRGDRLPLTGLIAQAFNFRAAYWFGAITVTAAFVMAALVLPPRSAASSRRFDLVGAGLLSLVVIGVGGAERGRAGWSSVRSLGVIVASVLLLAIWIPSCAAPSPVDLRQVGNRSVLTADASGFLICIALYLLLPIIVEFGIFRARPATGSRRLWSSPASCCSRCRSAASWPVGSWSSTSDASAPGP